MTQGNITKAVFNIDGPNPLVRLTIDGKAYTTFASHPSQEAFDLLCQYQDPLRNPLVGGWIDFEHVEKPNRSGGEPWLNITSITALHPLEHIQAMPISAVVHGLLSQPEENESGDRLAAEEETVAPPNPYEYYDSMKPPPVYLNADRYIGANIAYDQYKIDKRFAIDKALANGGRDVFVLAYKILQFLRDGDPRADGYTIGVEVAGVASGLNPVTAEETKDEETTKG
jgi:hypothetical protein